MYTAVFGYTLDLNPDLPDFDFTFLHRPDGHFVELAGLPGAVAVRDSKNPDGPKLAYTAAEWATFVIAVKTNDHDLP